MRRREFLGYALVAGAFAAAAQTTGRLFRVALLANTIPTADLVNRVPSHPAPKIIEDGLRELGWIDGKNIQFVWRSAETRYERHPALVDELVRMKVDVIIAFGIGAHTAAQRTKTVPIVMGTSGAVEDGIAESLSRPGGNVTGMTLFVGDALDGKKLALLKEAAPRTTRVAFLDHAPSAPFSKTTRAAADALGISIFSIGAESPDKLESAFDEAIRSGADGILIEDSPIFHLRPHQQTIHRLAIRHRVPVMHSVLSATGTGGLMAYGSDILENYRRVPYYVDKILRGAKPGELPIMQPTKFELVINRKAANSIGLELPASLLAAADRIVE